MIFSTYMPPCVPIPYAADPGCRIPGNESLPGSRCSTQHSSLLFGQLRIQAQGPRVLIFLEKLEAASSSAISHIRA